MDDDDNIIPSHLQHHPSYLLLDNNDTYNCRDKVREQKQASRNTNSQMNDQADSGGLFDTSTDSINDDNGSFHSQFDNFDQNKRSGTDSIEDEQSGRDSDEDEEDSSESKKLEDNKQLKFTDKDRMVKKIPSRWDTHSYLEQLKIGGGVCIT